MARKGMVFVCMKDVGAVVFHFGIIIKLHRMGR